MNEAMAAFFTNLGIYPDDCVGVLSMLMAAPEEVADSLGVGPTVLLAVDMAAKLAKQQHGMTHLLEMIKDHHEQTVPRTGVVLQPIGTDDDVEELKQRLETATDAAIRRLKSEEKMPRDPP